MKVMISKRAENVSAFRRDTVPFVNGRTGFLELLKALEVGGSDQILLPSYVGYSKNEGSGVFDPVREVGAGYCFYRMTRNLEIDLHDLALKLASRPKLVVFIHFFGYPDRAIHQAVRIARDAGAVILEDEAHAFYSDWVTGLCGRWGDATIFSIHKMLPFAAGGLLVINQTLESSVRAKIERSPARTEMPNNLLDYDLFAIAARRIRHAQRLHELLVPLVGKVDPLFAAVPEGVVPQTLPVIVRGYCRDELYNQMNASGFGAVSLYHSLIAEISEHEFPESHWLSRSIFNLPVHQDATDESLSLMVNELARLCLA